MTKTAVTRRSSAGLGLLGINCCYVSTPPWIAPGAGKTSAPLRREVRSGDKRASTAGLLLRAARATCALTGGDPIIPLAKTRTRQDLLTLTFPEHVLPLHLLQRIDLADHGLSEEREDAFRKSSGPMS